MEKEDKDDGWETVSEYVLMEKIRDVIPNIDSLKKLSQNHFNLIFKQYNSIFYQ